PPLAILPSTDHRIVTDQARPDPDERPVHVQYVTEIQHLTESGNFPCQIHPFDLARRRTAVDQSLAAGGAQRQRSGRGSGRGHPLSGTWETWMAPNAPPLAQSIAVSDRMPRALACRVRRVYHMIDTTKSRRLVMAVARVFRTGRSQAIRLPKEFRVEADTVYLKRTGEGF